MPTCPACYQPAAKRDGRTPTGHLRTVLAEYLAYYNEERPHRTLRLDTPLPAARSPTGVVHARSVLGGLHHAYARAA